MERSGEMGRAGKEQSKWNEIKGRNESGGKGEKNRVTSLFILESNSGYQMNKDTLGCGTLLTAEFLHSSLCLLSKYYSALQSSPKQHTQKHQLTLIII